MCAGAVSAFAVLWVTAARRQAGRRALAALLGALSAIAYTVVQSAGAARQSAGDLRRRRPRAASPLVAIAVTCSLAGFVLGLCVAYGRPVLRALAAAPAGGPRRQLAVRASAWRCSARPLPRPSSRQTRWLVGILLGLALATVGLRPARRLVVWVVALCSRSGCSTLAITVLVYVTVLLRPGAGLPDSLREVAAAGQDVFVQALLAHRPGPLVLAVLIGLAGSLLLPRLRPGGDRPPSTRHAPSESAPPSVLQPDHAAAGPGALEPATRHTDDAAAR